MKRIDVAVLALLTLYVVASIFPSVAVPKDLYAQYLPAARKLFRFQNPYTVPGFYNPPWVLLAFLPVAWMPDRIAASVWFMISLVAWLYIAWRSGLRGVCAFFFLVSPPVIYSLAMGGIDWIPILGLFLPHPWKWILAVIKPQITVGYMLAAIKNRRLASAVSGLLIGACWILYGFCDVPWSVALRPRVLALSAGMFLCHNLIYYRQPVEHLIGPVVTPYASFGSWAAVFLNIAQRWAIVPVVLIGWIVLVS